LLCKTPKGRREAGVTLGTLYQTTPTPPTSGVSDGLLSALMHLLEDDDGEDYNERQKDDPRDDDVEIRVVTLMIEDPTLLTATTVAP